MLHVDAKEPFGRRVHYSALAACIVGTLGQESMQVSIKLQNCLLFHKACVRCFTWGDVVALCLVYLWQQTRNTIELIDAGDFELGQHVANVPAHSGHASTSFLGYLLSGQA